MKITSRSFFSNYALARSKDFANRAEIRDGVSSLLSLHQGDADRLQRNQQNRIASANSDGRLVQAIHGIESHFIVMAAPSFRLCRRARK